MVQNQKMLEKARNFKILTRIRNFKLSIKFYPSGRRQKFNFETGALMRRINRHFSRNFYGIINTMKTVNITKEKENGIKQGGHGPLCLPGGTSHVYAPRGTCLTALRLRSFKFMHPRLLLFVSSFTYSTILW